MSGSDELLLKLKPLQDQGFVRIGDDVAVVKLINQRFPFIGSKIDWDAVPGSIVERLSTTDGLSRCRSFIADILQDFGGATSIVIVGDGAMNFGIETSLSEVGRCLDDVLELQQHTYITSPQCEWCIVFTMEGDMCFGNAPTPDSPP